MPCWGWMVVVVVVKQNRGFGPEPQTAFVGKEEKGSGLTHQANQLAATNLIFVGSESQPTSLQPIFSKKDKRLVSFSTSSS